MNKINASKICKIIQNAGDYLLFQWETLGNIASHYFTLVIQKIDIQIKIQGEELRADGKKRDDLQEAIAAIKTIDIGLPIEFVNFRE